MNHVFRLVWSKTRHMLIAVAEISGRCGKGGSPRARRARAPLFKLAPLAGALLVQGVFSGAVFALPSGGQVVSGQASISQSGNTLTVIQGSDKAILNWTRFGIGSGETVNFQQPNASSVALNRVLGSDPSAIYGQLNANGQVFLVNPNGVYFAPGAQVNVGGIVASTLDISDSDFLDGNYRFSGDSTAGVDNAGTINAAQGGYVAFIGNSVSNTGSITTPGGSTALGAGGSVNLTLADNSLLSFEVDGSALNALVENGGVIQADGGRVILSANAKDALLNTVVNNTGVIRAQTVMEHEGSIVLLGGSEGTTRVSGTLDASAPDGGNGGFIETSGAHLKVADEAVITTEAAEGDNGQWLIDPYDFTIAPSGGDITGAALSAALRYTDVTIETRTTGVNCNIYKASCGPGTADGNGDIFVNDTVTWYMPNTLKLNAWRNIEINKEMSPALSGYGGLVLQYGQGSSAGDGAALTINAPINLGASNTFKTQLGYSGQLISYTVITALGAQGSTTGADLQGINGGLAGNYVLGADIDASSTSGWNNGAGFDPIGNATTAFSGNFEGLGHTITGLTINRPTQDNVGLFGVAQGGEVRNIGIVGGSIKGFGAVGGLVGNSTSSAILHAYSTASVSGRDNVGGLVGHSNGGTIRDAYAVGNVSGENRVGGLVGTIDATRLYDSHAAGNVSGGSYKSNVGGLVGFSNLSTMNNVYATGSVSGSFANQVGGLIGGTYNTTISNAYATGSVSGSFANQVGGLIGETYNTTVSNAYATGSVTGGTDVGGLIGYASGGTITNTYAIGRVVGSGSRIGGLVGSNSSASFTSSYWDVGTTGQSLSAAGASINGAFTQGGYGGFDFTNDWWMSEGNTRPILRSRYSTTITDEIQLQLIATDLTASYTLANDIVMSPLGGSSVWNSATGFASLGNAVTGFSGSLDGQGHSIIGLTINRPLQDDVGLFSVVQGGTVRNVGLVGVSITGRDRVGGLVGSGNGATIDTVYSAGSVSGRNWVGGLVGAAAGSTISNAYSVSSVSGNNYIGGLIGRLENSNVTKTYAAGPVSASVLAGGLVGDFVYGILPDSYWDKEATGQTRGGGGASGSTTAQMQQQATFYSWDFTDTWVMYEGHTAPLLRAFMTPLTVTASAQTKTYNRSSAATLITPNYSVAGAAASGHLFGLTEAYGSAAVNVGTYASDLWSDQQGYIIDQTGVGALTITPREVVVSGLTAANKVYDGTTAAILTGTAKVGGAYAGDAVTVTGTGVANFADKNAGTGKAIIVSGYTLDGADAGNYTLLQPGALKANITPREITLTAPRLVRAYDGTVRHTMSAAGLRELSSQLVDGDTVAAASLSYASRVPGHYKALNFDSVTIDDGNDGDNYIVTLVGNNDSSILPIRTPARLRLRPTL